MLRNTRIDLAFAALMVIALAACNGNNGGNSDLPPTATLAPIVSQIPRNTATPLSSQTPLPTFTNTPSITPIPPTPSDTFTPTPTQPVIGIINSLQTVNVRSGPSTDEGGIVAVVPGTGVEVLGQNAEGTWFNVRVDDEEQGIVEGWVRSDLVRLQPTVTPIPTFTASPDLTALFLGTPLPTAILGGGTITPTPPLSAVTATPPGTPPEVAAQSGPTTPTEPFLPIIRDPASLYQTATALASGNPLATPRTAPTGTAPSVSLPSTPAPGETSPPVTPASNTAGSSGSTGSQQGVDVFAMCDTPARGGSAPTSLRTGATIDIFWAWFATSRELIDQHMNAVSYEVRVNDELLSNWRQYGITVRQQGDNFVKYWFVPFGPLEAGTYHITYRATWSEQVFDGYEYYGPGSNNPVEEGTCTFTVQ